MTISSLSALNAYQNQLKLAQEAADNAKSGDGTAAATSNTSFADLVSDAAKSAVDTQMNAEAVQMQALTGGKVELTNLVTAVANAELSLNTVVAVRDRVINAYQDIIKMTI